MDAAYRDQIIMWLDATDRAAGMANETAALSRLKTAIQTGDHQMARAIAQEGHRRAWPSVVGHFLEDARA